MMRGRLKRHPQQSHHRTPNDGDPAPEADQNDTPHKPSDCHAKPETSENIENKKSGRPFSPNTCKSIGGGFFRAGVNGGPRLKKTCVEGCGVRVDVSVLVTEVAILATGPLAVDVAGQSVVATASVADAELHVTLAGAQTCATSGTVRSVLRFRGPASSLQRIEQIGRSAK